jgi:hypothetical protein
MLNRFCSPILYRVDLPPKQGLELHCDQVQISVAVIFSLNDETPVDRGVQFQFFGRTVYREQTIVN